MRVAVLYSRVRSEEKLLCAALAAHQAQIDLIDDRQLIFSFDQDGAVAERFKQYDVVIARSLSGSRTLPSLQLLNSWGVKTVNTAAVVAICDNKLQTTSRLTAWRVPSPRTVIAYSVGSALQAVEELGYPVVLKPAVG